jgi:hypothetical protein
MSVSTSVSTSFAGGPQFNWNDESDTILGGPQCWIDEWDDGLENLPNQD